ncbi:hypothetical protein V1522DRAFT_169702 [Lipomyces starkeyi]
MMLDDVDQGIVRVPAAPVPCNRAPQYAGMSILRVKRRRPSSSQQRQSDTLGNTRRPTGRPHKKRNRTEDIGIPPEKVTCSRCHKQLGIMRRHAQSPWGKNDWPEILEFPQI